MIRVFNHYLSTRVLILAAIEALVLFQAMVLGFQVRYFGQSVPFPIIESLCFTVVMLLMMTALGLYESFAEEFRATIQRVIVAYLMTLVVLSVMFYLIPQAYVGRGVFALTSVFSVASLLLVRIVLFRVSDVGLPRRRVLILGNGREAEELIRFLHDGERGRTVQYAGLYPVTGERSNGKEERQFNHDHLLRTVNELGVSEIVIAVRERRGGVLPLRQLLDAKLKGIKVSDLASFYERELGLLQIDNMKASWLIFGSGFDQGMFRDVVKRIFDLMASLGLLIVTLPIHVAAMIAVVIESGFPIFYSQERVGQGSLPFKIYKLRSMVKDAEKDGKPRWAGANDARVTRVGKFIRRTRIDELPQLFNVLKGDMSFVGPRPERAFFVNQLVDEIPFYDVRHSVKPGVTGWSQVRYPYGASKEDALKKLQYDLYYVKNHSLFLDMLILVDTVQVVLLGKGAR